MKSRMKPALRVVPAAQVQLSLTVGGVLRDVQHAFYGLCVNAGKQVLLAMMEADRAALCGAKGVPDANRRTSRSGHTAGAVVLGGQRLSIKRPRARSIEQGELQLPSYAWAAGRDPLDAATLAAIAAGVSTRRYAGTPDELPPPEAALSVSKSAVSRRFVSLSQQQLAQWLSRSLKDIDLPVVMIDGIHFHDRVVLVALGIDAKGDKHVLGLREGSTESTRVVRSLLSDLIERGLDADRTRLWVIDGGKALRRAIVDCFGATALVQRCQEHKRRNVLEHLPEQMQASVGRALRDAWGSDNAQLARKQLQLGRVAAGQAPRRSGQPARGDRGDADGAGPGHHRGAVPHAANDQPDRELEWIDRALHAQRQALEGRPDDDALGGHRLERRQRALQKAARTSRHEDLAGCLRCACRSHRTRPTQGRVTSQQRNRQHGMVQQ
jgi:putative transposase